MRCVCVAGRGWEGEDGLNRFQKSKDFTGEKLEEVKWSDPDGIKSGVVPDTQ